MNSYQILISKFAPNVDPRHIEALMRIEHPTLDSLSSSKLISEIALCSEAAKIDPRMAEMIAQSFNL